MGTSCNSVDRDVKQAEEHKQRLEALRSDLKSYFEEFYPQALNPQPLRPPDPPYLSQLDLNFAIKTSETESEKESDAPDSDSGVGFMQDDYIIAMSDHNQPGHILMVEEESSSEESSTHETDLVFEKETIPANAYDSSKFPPQVSTYHLSIFDGTLLDCWIVEVENFFRLGEYRDEEKLDLISLSLEGTALKWFKKHKREFTYWTYFKRKLMARFGMDKSSSPPEILLEKELIPETDPNADHILAGIDKDVKEITEKWPEKCQSLLFPAVMPSLLTRKRCLIKKYMNKRLTIALNGDYDQKLAGVRMMNPQLICGDVKFHLKHKWRSRISQLFSGLGIDLNKNLQVVQQRPHEIRTSRDKNDDTMFSRPFGDMDAWYQEIVTTALWIEVRFSCSSNLLKHDNCRGLCGYLNTQKNLEDIGLFADLRVVKISTHHVAEAMSLKLHSPFYILRGASFGYALKVMHGDVPQAVHLPSSHHKWFELNSSVAKLDSLIGLTMALSLWITTVAAEINRVIELLILEDKDVLKREVLL